MYVVYLRRDYPMLGQPGFTAGITFRCFDKARDYLLLCLNNNFITRLYLTSRTGHHQMISSGVIEDEFGNRLYTIKWWRGKIREIEQREKTPPPCVMPKPSINIHPKEQ